ncbi:MAG: hypothetical protein AAB365_03365 [Patescibacteria group bacterium]
MNQENGGHKKLIALIIAFLLFLLAIGLFIAWWNPSETAPDSTETPPGFSPFDRPTTDRAIDARGTETPYRYTPPEPVAEPDDEPESTTYVPPASRDQAPPVTYIRSDPEYRDSFNVPSVTQASNAPIVYSEPAPTTYAPITYNSYTPQSYYVATSSDTITYQPADDGGGFKELDKEVWGYLTGLGWTQLLGDFGQQVYDVLYGLSPNGTTGATLGNFLPGAGGGGGGGSFGGGGFGGGGGGGLQNFGGRVNRVTYCTCASSIMLDINDVRGQTVSVIYQPGASRIFSNYNVYGTGQNVLGNYSPGGSCLVYHGEDCTPEGSPSGTIYQIGTSAQ